MVPTLNDLSPSFSPFYPLLVTHSHPNPRVKLSFSLNLPDLPALPAPLGQVHKCTRNASFILPSDWLLRHRFVFLLSLSTYPQSDCIYIAPHFLYLTSILHPSLSLELRRSALFLSLDCFFTFLYLVSYRHARRGFNRLFCF